jgi:hypothetical protein
MIKKGDKLYVPGGRRSHEQWSTVEKVGRKWITIDGGRNRVNKATLYGEHGGQFYRSKEEWLAEFNLRNAWGDLRRHIDQRLSPPDGVTIERIKEAAKLLGCITSTPEV